MTSRSLAWLAALTVVVSGCGGSDDAAPVPKHTVGGSVTGLVGTLVLQNEGGDDLTLTGDGPFEFATPVEHGLAYYVTVLSEPTFQDCTVTNAGGAVMGADVTSVAITCVSLNPAFVTSTVQTGNLGGLAGADAICAARAQAADLPGTFVAWLSTGAVTAGSRLGAARGWVRTDGLPFADTVADLTAVTDGAILHPLRLDEFKADVGGIARVFTGHSSSNCAGWTTADNAVTAGGGYAGGGTQLWSLFITSNCAVQWRLYCLGVDHANAIAVAPPAGRRAFLSSTSFLPGGGLAAADAVCQGEATSAGFAGTFKALLATDTASAASRFTLTGSTWYRPDGVAIVAAPGDLTDDLLLAPINVTTAGDYLGNYAVWQGASTPATVGTGTSCASWTSTSAADTATATRAAFSGQWSETAPCTPIARRLFCLQD